MGKKARAKVTGPAVKTREQARDLASEVVDALLKRQEVALEMQVRLDEIKGDYNGQLDELDGDIEAKTRSVKEWADGNPQEFGDKKSIEFETAVVGSRLDKPHVEHPFKKDADCLEAIERLGPEFAERLVATKKQLLKAAIADLFNAAAGPDVDGDARRMVARLAKIGVHMEQTEQFYIKPNGSKLPSDTSKVVEVALDKKVA